jgi:8-oxo-dGTP diphosphatase
MEINRPKVGIALYVKKQEKILLGKRIGKHAPNTWAAPGGHLEFGESWEECALRELYEEVGDTVKVENIKFFGLTNDIFSPEKHYITISLSCDYISGEVINTEPEKIERWDWFTWDNLPQPLMLPIQHLVEQNISPFDK